MRTKLGSWPGGPSGDRTPRPHGAENPPALRPEGEGVLRRRSVRLPTTQEIEERAAVRKGREEARRRRKRARAGTVVVVAVAVAVGLYLGYSSWRTSEEITAQELEEATRGELEHQVDRVMRELWQMEIDEVRR